MKKYLKQLHWQILIAMLLGVSLSFLLPPNKTIDSKYLFYHDQDPEFLDDVLANDFPKSYEIDKDLIEYFDFELKANKANKIVNELKFNKTINMIAKRLPFYNNIFYIIR